MNKAQETNAFVMINDVTHEDAGSKPTVQAYDPYFGRLFERSESFFRRCEATEQPDDGD